jgi:hypothetical protein
VSLASMNVAGLFGHSIRRIHFALCLAVAACTPKAPAVDLEAVKAAGDPMVRALMGYEQTHGHYAASLQEAGVAPVVTELGAFQYERRGEGADSYFVLFVGDYTRHGRVLFWNSGMEPQGWLTEE